MESDSSISPETRKNEGWGVDYKGRLLQTKKLVDLRLVDRSFTDLGYIGYGDGIDMEMLDCTRNWQFS